MTLPGTGREKKEDVGQRPESDVTQSDEEAVIARLKTDAKAGNVQAARELREWIKAQRERAQGADSIDTATTYAQLSAPQRLELRARLLDMYVKDGKLVDVERGFEVLELGAQAPVEAAQE